MTSTAPSHPRRPGPAILVDLALLLALAACRPAGGVGGAGSPDGGLATSAAAGGGAGGAAALGTPPGTAAAGGAEAAGTRAGPGAPAPLALWTVDTLLPASSEGPRLAGSAFEARVQAFQAEHPGPEVAVRILPAEGPAGIQPFIESTRRVMPAQLPDLALLPLGAIDAAAEDGLLKPITVTVALSDVFPFAAPPPNPAGEGVLALPVAVDLPHLIVRSGSAPERWSDVGATGPLVVGLGTGELPVLAPFLSWYLAAGEGPSRLDQPAEEPFAAAAGFAQAGLAEGRLSLPAGGASPRAAWNSFVSGAAPAAVVSGGLFAPQQAKFPGLGWAPLPGPEGPAEAVGWGWAWVVLASDPARAARAAALAAYLADPEAPAWVLEAGQLPAQRGAWQARLATGLSPAPDPDYSAFLYQALSSAQPAPGFAAWGPRWSAALRALAEGESVETATQLLAPNP